MQHSHAWECSCICYFELPFSSSAKSLTELIKNDKIKVDNLRILEVNEAGNLGSHLSQFALHRRVNYPEVDMHYLNDLGPTIRSCCSFGHSEHVDNPVHALHQCKSILSKSGHLIYTVPVVPRRLT